MLNSKLPSYAKSSHSTCYITLCDLLWQNREQVRVTSFSLSRNQQCRIFLSDTNYQGIPIQKLWNSLSITKAYLGWTIIKLNSRNEYCVCFVIDNMLIVNILYGSMHRIGPILVMQYCADKMRNICLNCNLFPVSPEQVTYAWWYS